AKAGKYKSTYPPYGYVKGEAPNHLPVVDPEAAAVVRRIFEMRAQGISPWHICYTLNSENIPIPSDYYYNKIGKRNPRRTKHLWGASNLRRMLSNPVYLGHLVQLKTTTVSYKNHKKVNREPEDMVIIENAHEPIISQELWDKVREVENSVSQGKRTKLGDITPLSGLMYCEDCGDKMHVSNSNINDDEDANNRRAFNCSSYNRFGKNACTSHFITYKDIEELILSDIRSMSECVMEDETLAREIFLKKKQQQTTDRLTALNKLHLKSLTAVNLRMLISKPKILKGKAHKRLALIY
ncbi:MAG: recombinase family protein, partial [Firmicutes bacterium]|nr:recombinase family protein [Bacillota bacterium]